MLTISIVCSPVNCNRWLFLLSGFLLGCNPAGWCEAFYRHRTGNSHLNFQCKSSEMKSIFPPKVKEKDFNYCRLVGGRPLANITLFRFSFTVILYSRLVTSYENVSIIHLCYVNLLCKTQSHKQIKYDFGNI